MAQNPEAQKARYRRFRDAKLCGYCGADDARTRKGLSLCEVHAFKAKLSDQNRPLRTRSYEKHKEAKRMRYAQRKRDSLCLTCGGERAPSLRYCAHCHKNRVKITLPRKNKRQRERRIEIRAQGLCHRCLKPRVNGACPPCTEAARVRYHEKKGQPVPPRGYHKSKLLNKLLDPAKAPE